MSNLKKYHHENNVVRCYDVTDPKLHEKGYTIYKVTERIIPVDAVEENISESVIWKRFNDFKKLYLSMSSLHTALHRREEFPEFSKPTLFNRFERSVIKERMQSAQDLLNFVGQRHYLVMSQAFKEFFKGSQPVPSIPLKNSKILRPDKLTDSLEDICPKLTPLVDRSISPPGTSDGLEEEEKRIAFLAPSSSPECLSDENLRIDSENLLEGIWRYRQVQDETSSGGLDDEDDDDDKNGSPLHSVLPAVSQSDLLAFDPLAPESGNQSSNPVSNEWLLSEVLKESNQVLCSDDRRLSTVYASELANILQNEADVPGDVESSFVVVPPLDNRGKSRTGSVVESGKGDLTESPIYLPDAAVKRAPLPTELNTSPLITCGIPSVPRWINFRRNTTNSHQPVPAYIQSASDQISQAQALEATEKYELAFAQYKCGIAMLLKGVQKDDDAGRVESIRKKISLYLNKAEELYLLHIHDAKEGNIPSHTYRWGSECSSAMDTSVALLGGAAAELGNLKVIGVVGKVLLVVDDSTNNGTFVIKVLHKCEIARDETSIVPTHIPYMVSLVKFYETENAIYLKLQHVAGGTLWNYISGYLNQYAQDRLPVDMCGDSFEKDIQIKGREDQRQLETRGKNAAKRLDSLLDDAVLSKKTTDSRDKDAKYFDFPNGAPARIESNRPSADSDCSVLRDDSDFGEVLRGVQPCSSFFSINSSESDTTPGPFRSDSTPGPIPSDIDPFPGSMGSENRKTDSTARKNSQDGTDVLFFIDGIQTLPSENNKKNISDESIKSNQLDSNVLESILEVSLNSSVHSHSSAENIKASSSLPINALCTENGRKHFPSFTRMCSQERSVESTGRRRHRTLSTAFKELDLAACETTEVRHTVQLPESCIKMWAAEIVVALSRLHVLGIICRDLHPGNILLGERGHILLTYFSNWNTVDNHLNEQAVENFYTAPEILGVFEVTAACDWWSFGALLYELVTGQSLRSCHPSGISSHTAIFIPDHVSVEARSLLTELLHFNPLERLGSRVGGSEEVKSHPFFAGIEWNHLIG